MAKGGVVINLKDRLVIVLAVLLGLMIVLNVNLLLGVRATNAMLDEPDLRLDSLRTNIEELLFSKEVLRQENEELHQLSEDETATEQDVQSVVENLTEENADLKERADRLQDQVEQLQDINESLESYLDEVLEDLTALEERIQGIGVGWLGVAVDTTSKGVRVVRVAENSPASDVHRLNGGYIREIDGVEIETAEQFSEAMAQRLPGQLIELTYVTRGGLFASQNLRTETVTLQRNPDS